MLTKVTKVKDTEDKLEQSKVKPFAYWIPCAGVRYYTDDYEQIVDRIRFRQVEENPN